MFLSFEKLLLPTAEILVNLSSAQPDLTNKYERKPISTGRYRKYWQVQEILAGTGNTGRYRKFRMVDKHIPQQRETSGNENY